MSEITGKLLILILAVFAIAIIVAMLFTVTNPESQYDQGKNITESLCRMFGGEC